MRDFSGGTLSEFLIGPGGVVRKASRSGRGAAGGIDIEAIADSLAPDLARSFLEAIAAIQDHATLEALATALERGDVGAVLAIVGLDNAALPSALPALQHGMQRAMVAAGTQAAAAIPPLARDSGQAALRVVFDVLNPRVIEFLRKWSFSLIKQISTETRENIRQVVTDGMRAGINPRQTAVAIRPALTGGAKPASAAAPSPEALKLAAQVKQSIGLTARQAKAVQNFRKELETFHLKRTAGGWNLGGKISRAPGGAQTYAIDDAGNPVDRIFERRLRDFRFDASLKQALETGKPLKPDQIERMVQRYYERFLKHRAEVISRTEAMRALNFAGLQGFEQAASQGVIQRHLVRRRWIVAKDERTCPVCKPVPEMNKGVEGYGIGIDDDFDTPAGPLRLPPAHPNCRCSVFTMTIEPEQVGRAKP